MPRICRLPTLWEEADRIVKGRISVEQNPERYLRCSGVISFSLPAAKPTST